MASWLEHRSEIYRAPTGFAKFQSAPVRRLSRSERKRGFIFEDLSAVSLTSGYGIDRL
ncbi:hypothetical protein NSU_3022 [Novosphingobium pentaromativorans US6-1]|uniref:Uncharacterized protein n=1 Tax=Novosphingobium pentaromativorans US6-1 TaxID=1088721 RepID=G6EFA1_9SPHN|nr:hypothetical protein NSU_3022 [Novosphingobium pentaromativorans US6-1]